MGRMRMIRERIMDILFWALIPGWRKKGWKPLHRAALGKDPVAVTVLIQRGDDVNVRDTDGNTPCDYDKASRGHLKLLGKY